MALFCISPILSRTCITCVRVNPLVSGMTHQDQTEVRRQMEEKVKRVGEMPNIRHRFGITFSLTRMGTK